MPSRVSAFSKTQRIERSSSMIQTGNMFLSARSSTIDLFARSFDH